MMNVAFTKGLHELGNGLFAYLQPQGGWGLANAGFIRDGNESLLIDTLIDGKHTHAMLRAIQDRTGLAARDINKLVNTHGDADHWFGNYLLKHADIFATKATAESMTHRPPEQQYKLAQSFGELGSVGEFFLDIFSGFDWSQDEAHYPNHLFEGRLDLKVGDKDVHLIQVGPAHTEGDTLVYCPQDRVVFTGDILFIEGTPIMWAGPIERWISACDQILAMDVDIIVPGHGPVTDKAGTRRMRDYLAFVDREARRCFDAGHTVDEAVEDIPLGDFANWVDSERIVVNVQRLYDEYNQTTQRRPALELFDKMATYRARHTHAGCGANCGSGVAK